MSGIALRGARVLVTGASRGLGAAIVAELARAGARVVLVARASEALDRVARGVGGRPFPCDLLDPHVTATLVARVEEAEGPLDALVNNAGLGPSGPILEQDDAVLEDLFRLNVLAPMSLCRQVLSLMIERGRGHVVNISSMAALSPVPGLTAYAASKAALSQYTHGLRIELAGLPVGVSLVEAGPITTEMLDGIRAYAPAAASYDRLARLGLLLPADRDEVARRTVQAIARGRARVRVPVPASLASMIASVPRRLVELAIAGVPRRD